MGLKENHLTYLSAEFTISEDTLKISGLIDSATPGEFLTPFFKDLHKEIVDCGLKKINVDITGLSYINSSSIKEFVSWIIYQKSLPDENKYVINFICNPEYMWQDSSISTISFLNPKFITKQMI